MRRTVLAFAVLPAALLAAPASAALSDFRLPGDTARQPEPERVGPVAPDVPESRAPAPTPAPARQTTPAPAPAEPRIEVPNLPVVTAEPSPARTAGTPATTRQAPSGETSASDAAAPAPVATDGTSLPEASTVPTPYPASTASAAAAAGGEGGSFWVWVLATLGALAALAFAGWAWQRQRPVVGPAAVPQLERPRLAPAAAPAASAEPLSEPLPEPLPEPLQVTLDPLRLSLTLMNATLAYRLEVANRGAAPIVNLAIGADMICAHASMSREQQLSGPGAGAATVQRIERLEPGESRIVEGEFRVPFTQIVPIRQGNAALLLPLARFRLETEGAAPVVRTFAVGQPGAKAALQPFRLDLGPRVYPRLTQRAFA